MNSQRIAPINNPILNNSPLFENLSELELNAVAAFLEPRKIDRGEVIFSEGEAGKEMYILISGEISAWVSRPDGSRHWMFEIKPGDFFGEMSVIANENRSATLKARSDVELMIFYGLDFYRFIYEHPIIGIKLLKAIRKVQNTWLEQTSQNLNDLMRWGETARRRAVSDDLTGLYNRRFLDETASSRFKQGAVGPRSISLMMIDLDRFREINNIHDHKVGDQALRAAADILRSSTRADDICVRLSGDEFAVLLPDTGPKEAMIIAERVRETLASRQILLPVNPVGYPDGNPAGYSAASETVEISIRTSIGIASAPNHADTWEALYKTADKALRSAKELGRNRVEIAKI
jgi:diguanylate cyclase (GGDEF)-like protein